MISDPTAMGSNHPDEETSGDGLARLIALPLVDCWNRVGIRGDRSCPELAVHAHCHDCPVFATAARSFFDRPAPAGYLADWSRWLAAPDELTACHDDDLVPGEHVVTGRGVALLIFRLGNEWLAFDAQTIAEVAALRPIHKVPHRTNAIFRGIVNLRGQILLCVSLHGLLGVDPAQSSARLVVLRDRERSETWAFAADEVVGVERVASGTLGGLPATLANPAVGLGKAVVSWRGRSVDLLDEQRVFTALGGIFP